MSSLRPSVIKQHTLKVEQQCICNYNMSTNWGSSYQKLDDFRITLEVLNFWKISSYCSLKPIWSGMGEVVPARTSPTLHPPSPPTVHQSSRLAL